MGYTFVDVDSLEGEAPGGLELITFDAPLDAKYEPPDWG